MAWFHLKLEDFPDAEIPQLVECFFPGKGVLQTTLFQDFETKEQPSTESQEVSKGLQNVCVPSGSPSSMFRTMVGGVHLFLSGGEAMLPSRFAHEVISVVLVAFRRESNPGFLWIQRLPTVTVYFYPSQAPSQRR